MSDVIEVNTDSLIRKLDDAHLSNDVIDIVMKAIGDTGDSKIRHLQSVEELERRVAVDRDNIINQLKDDYLPKDEENIRCTEQLRGVYRNPNARLNDYVKRIYRLMYERMFEEAEYYENPNNLPKRLRRALIDSAYLVYSMNRRIHQEQLKRLKAEHNSHMENVRKAQAAIKELEEDQK